MVNWNRKRADERDMSVCVRAEGKGWERATAQAQCFEKKAGRLSVVFDEREWGGRDKEDWQARSGLSRRSCNGVDIDLADLGCERGQCKCSFDQGLHSDPFDLPASP